MAVAVDSILSTDIAGAATTAVNLTGLTVGAGSNRFLIAGLTLQASATAPSLHWDTAGTNQAMSLIGSIADTSAFGKVWLYGLVAPTSGNKTLGATWTGNSDATLAGACFTGVDQVTPTAHLATNTGGASPMTVVVTSAVGNYVIGLGEANTSITAGTPNAWYTDNTPSNFSSAGAHATGAATVTLSYVLGGSIAWAAIGIDLQASTGAVAAPFVGTIMALPPASRNGTISLVGWTDPLKLLLQSKDRFRGLGGAPQFDWPNPIRATPPSAALKTWIDPLKLALRSKDTFFGLGGAPQFDWPNPIRAPLPAPQTWPTANTPQLNLGGLILGLDATVNGTAAGPVSVLTLPGLTTINGNTVLIVTCRLNASTITSISDNHGLPAWTLRAAAGNSANRVEEWYTTATAVQSNLVITLHFAGGTATNITANAFAVMGANTNRPFDGTPSTGSADPATLSTTAGYTFSFAAFSFAATASPTAGNGLTQIFGGSSLLTEFVVNTQAQPSVSLSVGTGVGNADDWVGDVIVAGPAPGNAIGQFLDWPLPPKAGPRAISLWTWTDPLKLQLAGRDAFFGLAGAPQFSWPNPTRAALSVPPTWIDPLKLTLSFVIAPFSQTDWPVPPGPLYPSDLRTFLNSLEVLLAGKDQFFGLAGAPQFDWPVPKGPVGGISLRTWTDPLKLLLVDAFFGLGGSPQFNWPNPIGPKPLLQAWTDPLKLQLSSKDQFFGLAGSPTMDWPVPRGFIPGITLKTWIDPFKGQGTDAFFGLAGNPQRDWPNPGRAAPLVQGWIDPYKFALNGIPAPFSQGSWPNPAGPVFAIALRTWTDPFKGQGTDTFFGLAGNPQHDWPNPRGPAPLLQAWTDSYRLALNGVPVPFIWQDWPNPRGRPPLLQDWQVAVNLDLLGKDTFFGLAGAPQRDWPNPQRPAPLLQQWVDPFKFTLNILAAPFVQGSWPNPAGPTYAITMRTWIDPFKGQGTDRFFGLAGAPQRDWPNPRGAAPVVPMWLMPFSLTLHATLRSGDPFIVSWS